MKKKLILLGIILIGMSSCCSDNKTTINSSSESGDTIFLQKGESFKDIIINDGNWSTRYMITEDSTLGIHKVYKLDNLYNKFELKYIIKEEKK